MFGLAKKCYNLMCASSLASYPPQTPPTLVGPTAVGTSVNFHCQVAYAGTAALSADTRFDVTFLFDGIADPDTPVVTVTAGNRALLEETHLQGHFGKEVMSSTGLLV